MPAHLIDLTEPTRDRPKCQSCSKRAVVRLRNTWNASNGVFCRACGKRALEKQLAAEDEAWKREHDLTRMTIVADAKLREDRLTADDLKASFGTPSDAVLGPGSYTKHEFDRADFDQAVAAIARKPLPFVVSPEQFRNLERLGVDMSGYTTYKATTVKPRRRRTR